MRLQLRWTGGLCILLLVLVLPALAPAAALACTPPPGGLPNLSSAERASLAPLVLEGSVTALSDGPPRTASITVHQYLKGSGPEQVQISGFGPSSLCLSDVSVGQRLIFYVQSDADGQLRAFYASQFDAVAPADPQTLGTISAIAGQTPVIPAAPTAAAETPPQTSDQPLWVRILGIIAIAVLLGAGVLVQRANVRRQEQRARREKLRRRR